MNADMRVAAIATAIGEPTRARMLFCLMDGHARTGTELAIVAEVSPSTASVHLQRLATQHLVSVLVQGKHRYYSLQSPEVAGALEALSVLAGGVRGKFKPSTPSRLCAARTCYDHMAGAAAVSLHDRFLALGWMLRDTTDVTAAGAKAFQNLGIDIAGARALRRKFSHACLDWSERRPHVGGALGAEILRTALRRKWVVQDLDSRALEVTRLGRREMMARFGARV